MRHLAIILLALTLFLTGTVAADTGEFEQLIKKKGPAAREVLEKPTLYRVAKIDGLPCTADGFEFLLDRPRLSVALARKLDPGLDEYRIEVRPDGSYHLDDGGPLAGDMEIISRQPGKRVYYLSGGWKFIWGIRFNGRMVLVPEYHENKTGAGKGVCRSVNATARGYMKIDSSLVGTVARLMAKLFPGKVDARIARFSGSVRKVAIAISEDPVKVYRVLRETKGVPPEEVEEYRKVFIRK